MRIAEAMHVDCFDTDARATIATLAATDTLTSIFFTVAPGVECVILSTHDVRCELFNWKLFGVVACLSFGLDSFYNISQRSSSGDVSGRWRELVRRSIAV